MVSHLFHDPRWTGKSGRETYSKKNWRRTNWKTCPTLNRLLPPAFDISNDKIEMLWQQEFTRGRDDEPVAKLKSKTIIITYPEIWFLELPAAIFLRPLLWLTPATLNLNTYSEGGMASEVEKLHLQLICTVYAHHEARFSSRRPFLERSIQ